MRCVDLLRAACVALLLALGTARAAEQASKLAFLGFEIVDEQPQASDADVLARRLAAIDEQFRAALEKNGLYDVVDRAPAKPMLDKLRAQQEFLYRCNGCLGDVGRRLDVPLVAVGWVQKVSNLILNLNIEIHDTATDRIVLTKSVDLRGNTDQTWARAVSFMVRDMAEKRKRDPGYGR